MRLPDSATARAGRGRCRGGARRRPRPRSDTGLELARAPRGPRADVLRALWPQPDLEGCRRSDARLHEHVRPPRDVAPRPPAVRPERDPDRGARRQPASREAAGRDARAARLSRVAPPPAHAPTRHPPGGRPRRVDRRVVLAGAREAREVPPASRRTASERTRQPGGNPAAPRGPAHGNLPPSRRAGHTFG